MLFHIVLQENCNESIIWNIHLKYPLALICRDNECLDLYNLQTAHCVKSLKHESKVGVTPLISRIIVRNSN